MIVNIDIKKTSVRSANFQRLELKRNNMTANYKFVGNYQINGSYLISKNLKLLISERKKPTLNKPKYFLIDKSGTKGTYISSLYYVAENQYYFDFNGTRYELTYISDSQAVIQSNMIVSLLDCDRTFIISDLKSA